MKKMLFVLSVLVIFSCFFALSVSAQKEITGVTNTYYVVSAKDSDVALSLEAEGKETLVLSEIYSSTSTLNENDWIAQFDDGAHIELIFAENIVEEVGQVGILLSKAITLTVRYNGFCHLVTNRASWENVFVLRNGGAQLNLIGSSEIYDENGNVIKDFTYSPNDLSKNVVQIYHTKVYAWVHSGGVYAENIRSSTGQELVYVQSTVNNGNNVYEFVDCAAISSTTAIGLMGQGQGYKIVKINGGYYNNVVLHTVLNGSLIENCEIDSFTMDCWNIGGQMLELKGCTIGSITTYTGRTHLTLIDCKFDVSKLSLGSDGGGKCYALIYNTATCENAGILNIYRNGNGTTPVTDDSRYPYSLVEEYASNNPKLGHIFSYTFSWADNNTYAGTCTALSTCERCGGTESEEIEPMITKKGFSVPMFGTIRCILLGFEINHDAIARYEELSGSSIEHGIVVALEQSLNGENPLDENGNPAALEQGKVFKFDATAYETHSIVVFKINLTEEYFDTSVLMTGYIIETSASGDISVSYVQEKFIEDGNFLFTSYNIQANNAIN